LHPSSVQTSLSVQLIGEPAHFPAVQMSPLVHASLSLQAAVLSTCPHPSSWSHASSVHGSPSSQLGGGPPTH
jgi:hypothetical protein